MNILHSSILPKKVKARYYQMFTHLNIKQVRDLYNAVRSIWVCFMNNKLSKKNKSPYIDSLYTIMFEVELELNNRLQFKEILPENIFKIYDRLFTYKDNLTLDDVSYATNKLKIFLNENKNTLSAKHYRQINELVETVNNFRLDIW